MIKVYFYSTSRGKVYDENTHLYFLCKPGEIDQDNPYNVIYGYNVIAKSLSQSDAIDLCKDILSSKKKTSLLKRGKYNLEEIS